MLLLCQACHTAYRTVGEATAEDRLLTAEKWRESFPCITSLCRGRLFRVSVQQFLQTEKRINVPINQFYRAIHGGGYKDPPAPFDEVRSLLLTKKIVEVHGSGIGQPERSIISTIVLSDGTQLHLDSSSKGACVYYVEQQRFEDGPKIDGSIVYDSSSNREEDGRTVEAASAVVSGAVHPNGDGTEDGQQGTDLSSMSVAGDK